MILFLQNTFYLFFLNLMPRKYCDYFHSKDNNFHIIFCLQCVLFIYWIFFRFPVVYELGLVFLFYSTRTIDAATWISNNCHSKSCRRLYVILFVVSGSDFIASRTRRKADAGRHSRMILQIFTVIKLL